MAALPSIAKPAAPFGNDFVVIEHTRRPKPLLDPS